MFSFLAPFSPLIFFSALILGLTSFFPGSSESESMVMTAVALRFFALELEPALPFEGPAARVAAAAGAGAGWAISEAVGRRRVTDHVRMSSSSRQKPTGNDVKQLEKSPRTVGDLESLVRVLKRLQPSRLRASLDRRDNGSAEARPVR